MGHAVYATLDRMTVKERNLGHVVSWSYELKFNSFFFFASYRPNKFVFFHICPINIEGHMTFFAWLHGESKRKGISFVLLLTFYDHMPQKALFLS